MKLGIEVGLGPGNIVRWGPSPPPQKKGHPLNFRPMYVVAKRHQLSTKVLSRSGGGRIMSTFIRHHELLPTFVKCIQPMSKRAFLVKIK